MIVHINLPVKTVCVKGAIGSCRPILKQRIATDKSCFIFTCKSPKSLLILYRCYQVLPIGHCKALMSPRTAGIIVGRLQAGGDGRAMLISGFKVTAEQQEIK